MGSRFLSRTDPEMAYLAHGGASDETFAFGSGDGAGETGSGTVTGATGA